MIDKWVLNYGMTGKMNMEMLEKCFGMSLNLFEKEKGGVRIGKKEVEGALVGFNHCIIA